jgi:ACR3 family arsenite transporter
LPKGAAKILIQVHFNSGVAYMLNRISGERHCVAGPSACSASPPEPPSRPSSVLVEVPVMLSVVWIVNRSKGWYERGAGAPTADAPSEPAE